MARNRENYGNLLGQYFITLWYFRHEFNKAIEYEFNAWASVDRFEQNKKPVLIYPFYGLFLMGMIFSFPKKALFKEFV